MATPAAVSSKLCEGQPHKSRGEQAGRDPSGPPCELVGGEAVIRVSLVRAVPGHNDRPDQMSPRQQTVLRCGLRTRRRGRVQPRR